MTLYIGSWFRIRVPLKRHWELVHGSSKITSRILFVIFGPVLGDSLESIYSFLHRNILPCHLRIVLSDWGVYICWMVVVLWLTHDAICLRTEPDMLWIVRVYQSLLVAEFLTYPLNNHWFRHIDDVLVWKSVEYSLERGVGSMTFV